MFTQKFNLFLTVDNKTQFELIEMRPQFSCVHLSNKIKSEFVAFLRKGQTAARTLATK